MMRSRFALASVFAAGLVFPWPAFAGPVKMVSVETKAALPPEAEDIIFGQHPDKGTEVKATFLVYPDEGGAIVEIKEKKCRVTETVEAGSGQPLKWKIAFGSFPKVAKDGSIGAHSLEYSLPEEPGSERVKVGGVLAVVMAMGVKTEKVDSLALANGSGIKAGDLKLEVKDVTRQGGKTRFSLHSTKRMSVIKAIRFFRLDGSEIPSDQNGRSWGSMFGAYSEDWQFELKGEIGEMKLEIDLHQNVTEKEIPFDFVLPSAM